MANNNMIKVDGVKVKTPSSFQLSINDISRSDAGRTEDGLMHKNRIGRKRKIVMTWAAPSVDDAHAILSAFAPEYVRVQYFDPIDNATVTRTFYSGDQTAPVKRWTVNNKVYESIQFDIIER